VANMGLISGRIPDAGGIDEYIFVQKFGPHLWPIAHMERDGVFGFLKLMNFQGDYFPNRAPYAARAELEQQIEEDIKNAFS